MIGGQRNDKNGWNCIGICVEQVFSIYLSVYWRLYYTMSLYLSCEMEGRIGRGESLLLRIDHDGVFFFSLFDVDEKEDLPHDGWLLHIYQVLITCSWGFVFFRCFHVVGYY